MEQIFSTPLVTFTVTISLGTAILLVIGGAAAGSSLLSGRYIRGIASMLLGLVLSGSGTFLLRGFPTLSTVLDWVLNLLAKSYLWVGEQAFGASATVSAQGLDGIQRGAGAALFVLFWILCWSRVRNSRYGVVFGGSDAE